VRVSLADDGSEAVGDSRNASISVDGRFVTFHSGAANLVSGDTNNSIDVFVRDTCLGTLTGCVAGTTRVSVALNNSQADTDSFFQAINGTGILGWMYADDGSY